MLTRYVPIGNARRTSIANIVAKKRMPPVVKKIAVNANGSKSESCVKHVNVIGRPNTRQANTDLGRESEGCHRILVPAASQDKGRFPLTGVEGHFLSRFLLTMEVVNSQDSVLCPHTMEADSSQANVLCPHTTEEANSQVRGPFLRTTEEVNSQVRGPSPHTSPVERSLVSALFRLTTEEELCRATNPFLLTTLGVHYRVLNLSHLISVAGVSQEPTLLPRTTPTPITGLPITRSRGKWAT